MIDLYCERTTSGLWGEPFNTLSNLAFLIAAFAAWRLARRHASLNADTGLLLLLLLAIGIGSTLFHMFASGWSEWLDVIPITLFQFAFLTLYLRRIAGLHALPLLVTLALFLAASYAAAQCPQLINGSVGYLPALTFLTALSIHHLRTSNSEPWLLLAASGLFLMSLLFRTVDNAVCGILPTGTHMFWHLCNSIVLYLTIRVFIMARHPWHDRSI